MRALIIDDEPLTGSHLKELIRMHCFEIENTIVVNKTQDALNELKKGDFEILFLDIQMPEMNGFELLEKAKLKANASLIIVTAFEEYALPSFKNDALAYLVKPVDEQELIKAVRKAARMQSSIASVGKSNRKRIKVYDKDEYHLLEAANLIRLEADGNYTKLISVELTHLSTQRIGYYESELLGSGFFRVHRSHLINLSFLQKVGKKSDGYLELKDGTILPLSSSKRNELLARI